MHNMDILLLLVTIVAEHDVMGLISLVVKMFMIL